MQNKILIEGDDKYADYNIMCTGDFLSNVIISLFKHLTIIDSDGIWGAVYSA